MKTFPHPASLRLNETELNEEEEETTHGGAKIEEPPPPPPDFDRHAAVGKRSGPAGLRDTREERERLGNRRNCVVYMGGIGSFGGFFF